MSLSQASESESINLKTFLAEGKFEQAAKASTSTSHYLAELLAAANTKKLHEAPVWRTLVHYKSSLFLGTESLVDSQSFFLADNGKFDPQSELHATLASFFSDAAIAPTEYPAQCRFPARYQWLKTQLNFDSHRLAENPCETLQKYYDAIDPAGITVIFPSTHPNSPSSMFGHTLLRIDKKNQTDETRMLAFSISYAAVIPQDQGMLSYTVFGLTGGFPGSFNVLPYYVKLREYGQIENRDVWEYRLNIPKEEVDFLLMHAFELVYAYFDYYFFTENCSYHLLSLLDVLYADEPLTEDYDRGWTIPVDTIKTLEKKGLIEDARFYPSQARMIYEQRNALNEEENALAFQTYQLGVDKTIDQINQRDERSRIHIFDLVTEYLRFAKVRDSEKAVSSKLTTEERKVLLHRSKIRQKSAKLDIPAPGLRPDKGHNTSRLGLSRGIMRQADTDTLYSDLTWRAAYHDLLDPSQGFASNSSLSFMDIGLRKYDDLDDIKLQSLTILDIQSLEPRDEFFTSTSWHTEIKWYRAPTDQWDDWYFSAQGGSGYAYLLNNDQTSTWYGFLDAGIQYFQGTKNQHQTLWGGLSTGLILEPYPGWRVQLAGNYKARALGYELNQSEISLNQSIATSRNSSVRFSAQRLYQDNNYINKALLNLYFYH